MRWIEHALGLDDASGPLYLWWSGAAGYVFATVLYLKHNNCHEHRCWRVGRHPVNGTPFTACRKHHPETDHKKPIRLRHHHLTRHMFGRQ